jgi:hypothetical protein
VQKIGDLGTILAIEGLTHHLNFFVCIQTALFDCSEKLIIWCMLPMYSCTKLYTVHVQNTYHASVRGKLIDSRGGCLGKLRDVFQIERMDVHFLRLILKVCSKELSDYGRNLPEGDLIEKTSSFSPKVLISAIWEGSVYPC